MLIPAESSLQPLLSNFKDSVTLCHLVSQDTGVPLSLCILNLVPAMTMYEVRPENTKTANRSLAPSFGTCRAGF